MMTINLIFQIILLITIKVTLIIKLFQILTKKMLHNHKEAQHNN